MLNKKIIGLFVLGLALSSPLQNANAFGSPDLGTDSTGGSSSELTCYEPKQCKSGYTMSADGKSCTLSVTTYATKAECERNNLINECVSDGNGKYIAGDCISLTDASTGVCYLSADSQDCVNDFFTTGCTTIAASRYVPTGCIAYTQAECEAKYPYDICEKLSRVNCWGPEGGGKYDIPAVQSCTNGVSSIETSNYANTYHVCAAKTQADCQTVYPGFNCIKVDEQGIGTVYVPAGCKDGYNFENGYCVADGNACNPSTYDAFLSALSNSACTTVTLANDIVDTEDKNTKPLYMLANQTLDGNAYTLNINRAIYSKGTIKNLTLINHVASSAIYTTGNTAFDNVHIETSGKGIDGEDTITIANSTIKAYGNNALNIEIANVTIPQGTQLIIEVSDSIGVNTIAQSTLNVYGDLYINATNSIGMANEIVLNVYNGANVYINDATISGQSLSNITIAEGGNVEINTNSTDTSLSVYKLSIAGTLDIKAPIANNKSFIELTSHEIDFTSGKAKLITTSTGSRTLSDTSLGIGSLGLIEAKKGATWQVKSSGFNKTWECQEDYVDTYYGSLQAPYWCDATTGCTPTCAEGEYTTDAECTAAYPNAACGPTIDGCFGPEFCATGFTRLCEYGTIINNDGSGCGICAYSFKGACEAQNPGFACEPIIGSDGVTYYQPSDTCVENYNLLNGECVFTCQYTSLSDCEAQNPGFECKEYYDSSTSHSN